MDSVSVLAAVLCGGRAPDSPRGAGSPPAPSHLAAWAAGLGDPCARGVASALRPLANTDFL